MKCTNCASIAHVKKYCPYKNKDHKDCYCTSCVLERGLRREVDHGLLCDCVECYVLHKNKGKKK